MKITANFSVETIENGWIVRDVDAGRAVHVGSNSMIADQVEQMMHDIAERALADGGIVQMTLKSEPVPHFLRDKR